MSPIKPSVPKGTRDFSPPEMAKRNFIFDTIKTVFRKYGYLQIETPALENLSTLMGKYGEEGDRLIFKILNSGDFLAKVDRDKLSAADAVRLAPAISEKALRYDLTVPFARYVVMHQNEITLPFKRFQIQPVWRADRPQKGRYREFSQCDADVVGSSSLLNEAEFVLLYDEALSRLGLRDFSIKLNNRKILSGIASLINKTDQIVDFTIVIDKLDKIGLEGVISELSGKGFSAADIETIRPVILLGGTNEEKLSRLREILSGSAIGLKGCEEVGSVLDYIRSCPLERAKLELDITLARGLNYYTGAILEVKTNEVQIGSIGGGGRYDDLTGMFGQKGLTGVGISFGADRIYDVMEELRLFPAETGCTTRILICCFDAEGERFAMPILKRLRQADIPAEIYPAVGKIKKQLDYANARSIPFALMIGSDEMESGQLTLKDMSGGGQQKVTAGELVEKLSAVS